VKEYPILTIEDPFDQDDWAHYSKITEIMGDKVQIVGDDLLVTNPTVHLLALNSRPCLEQITVDSVM
jgi:enolase